ncbi:MAG: hypothetical protein NZM43_04675 [Saprospiraceae bacterium]|nr:hypothetical protein [Saprospiraceae bacterium]MDW8483603.1 hypothetical protein [Saprospiraceae bacterium]
MTKQARKFTNVFEEAVLATPDISTCYQKGLQALGSHSTRISPKNPPHCQGSVSLDTCLRSALPNANRWDYALGYADRAYFVEVHSAMPKEVKVVLQKFNWLKDWLDKKATGLKQIKADKPFHGIADKIDLLPTAKEYLGKLLNLG